jgi:hypothetical protein
LPGHALVSAERVKIKPVVTPRGKNSKMQAMGLNRSGSAKSQPPKAVMPGLAQI